MKKLSEIYKELGIAFSFPIEIEDDNGKLTYFENSSGFWNKYEWDDNGKPTHYEDSDGYWGRYEYGDNGNQTYYEDSTGVKKGTTQRAQLDALGDKIKDAGLDSADYNGNQTYFETSNGVKQGIPKSTNQ